MGLLPLSSSYTMIVAAPDGAPLRRIDNSQLKKNSLPAVPRRGPEAGVHHIYIYPYFAVLVRTESNHICFVQSH